MNSIAAELWMLPDLWTAPTDAPTTRSLEIASRFPQHPQPKPTVSRTDLNGTEDPQILCPPLGVAGFQTFFTGRIRTFGDKHREQAALTPLEAKAPGIRAQTVRRPRGVTGDDSRLPSATHWVDNRSVRSRPGACREARERYFAPLPAAGKGRSAR